MAISFLGLFYELALIRWLPANILSLAFFSNIVLISCFLGIGLGCLLAGRRWELMRAFAPMLLLAVLAYLLFRNLEVVLTDEGREWIWSGYRPGKPTAGSMHLGILPTLVIVFALNTVLFIPLGQKMGRLMEKFDPIRAYSLNIAGSLLGVVAFAAFSIVGGFLNSPELWFAAAGVVTLWFSLDRKMDLAIAVLCMGTACAVVARNTGSELWSPYYSIQLRPGPKNSLMLYVNRFYHQRAIDFAADPQVAAKYAVPYRKKIPGDLLILGAGTGNDTGVANLNHVPRITAVEIDPSIVMLGRQLHPSRAYDAKNVEVVVNDARSFLRRTTRKFDMVVFGTLDSHALLSSMSTVRLDNFVYTVQCLEDVKRCLKPGGVAVLMFSVQRDWIKEKFLQMCGSVFPEPRPLVFASNDDLSYNFMIVAGPGVNDYAGGQPGFEAVKDAGTRYPLPTDDWPYLYLKERTIPAHYLKSIALLSLISIAAVWLASPKAAGGFRIDLNFFSLGCAFLLLETKSVTTLSLVFGSTWIVNAFVFGAILIMILLANLWIVKRDVKNLNGIYALLFATLALNYAVPVSSFLTLGYWARAILSVVWVALPLFFSAILFGAHLRAASTKGLGWIFGSNLVGAVLGGFLEYASMATGLNFLYALAAFFYLLSFIANLKSNAVPQTARGHSP
ncbi:MAG: methyltransferase domain-containing protein [Verrucomicrobiae bacterium]|nr:methyltransferase domain-containing protein [Verrucomicrobiae bacterium]